MEAKANEDLLKNGGVKSLRSLKEEENFNKWANFALKSRDYFRNTLKFLINWTIGLVLPSYYQVTLITLITRVLKAF